MRLNLARGVLVLVVALRMARPNGICFGSRELVLVYWRAENRRCHQMAGGRVELRKRGENHTLGDRHLFAVTRRSHATPETPL